MHGYLKINGEKLPDPESYDIDITDVTKENTTEAGTSQIIKVRTGVYTVSASFIVKSKWLQKFTKYRSADELSVELYDPESDTEKEKVMRIEGYKANLRKESENVKRTNGIWDISFTLKEF